MGSRSVRMLVLVLGAALLGGGPVTPTAAQETAPPGTMGVWMPNLAALGFENETYQDLLGGTVFVFADATFCGAYPVAEPTLVVIGAPNQPDSCRADGALIEFANAHGLMMFDTVGFKSDSTVVFNNFAPWPSDTFYPAHVCTYFASASVESTACQMIGPPSPGASGNVGLETRQAPSPRTAFAMVGGVLIGMLALRQALGRGRPG